MVLHAMMNASAGTGEFPNVSIPELTA